MIEKLIAALPKAELHLHIEGSLSPELMMQLAQKHDVSLPYKSLQEIEAAYQFEDLQSFLDLYYLGAAVLIEEDDFYQLMWAYLSRCKADNVVHAEVMFDPQTHTQRGIGFDVFMNGFKRAIHQAEQEWGMSVMLILSYLRHLPEKDALQTLQQASNYIDDCVAVGLDSSELGNPPENFATVFSQSAALGLKRVAHAGEEGPPEYIWSAIKNLQVDRIDHGVRCIEDPDLVDYLKQSQLPLTVCPLSNIKLCVFDDLSQHNILQLLEQGLMVTVNSDDPTYFGGFLNDNYRALHQSLSLTDKQLIALIENSFKASFLPESRIQYWLNQIDLISNRLANSQ